MKINREELAWAAGFFDGEGCTYNTVRNDRKGVVRIGLTLSQLEVGPLVRFHAAILGLGRVCSRGDGMHQWQCANWRAVLAVIALLWTFLSEPKRRQFRAKWTAFTSYPHWGRRPGRPLTVAA